MYSWSTDIKPEIVTITSQQAVESNKEQEDLIWNYYISLNQLVLLITVLWKMEIMLKFVSWNQAQHDWQDIIPCAAEKKAIPFLWFLYCWFFLWNCGPSLEYRSEERALIWKILHGGGRTWETITLGGFLFHPLASVIWRYALVCNFSSPQLPAWPPSYATLFPPLCKVGFCLGRHMKQHGWSAVQEEQKSLR